MRVKFSRRTTALLDWLAAHRIGALIAAAFAVGIPLAWTWTGTAGLVADAFVLGVLAGNGWSHSSARSSSPPSSTSTDEEVSADVR